MSAFGLPDPVGLASALMSCCSVTPADDGALDVLARALTSLGFDVAMLPFGPAGAETPNLFARIGDGSPHVCFAGHTDVVPPGEGWSVPPFASVLRDGTLIGRGACDMKGAVAAFVAACAEFLEDGVPEGTLSLLVTGDEEGIAAHGTRAVVDWLDQRGWMPDFCLVGEPTNPERLGQVIKIGRRGSVNAVIEVRGVQGHVAYPDRADNPVHRLILLLAEAIGEVIDGGSELFEPSRMQVTSIDVGNPAGNVIPGRASARLNVRFNDCHDGASLEVWIRALVGRHAPGASVEIVVSAEPFLSAVGPETMALAEAVRAVTGLVPSFDTGGGSSDARFLAPLCRVAEFGLVGASMHQVDEHVPVADLLALAEIYGRWLASVLPRRAV